MDEVKLECHNCGAQPGGLMDIGAGRLCLDCYGKYTQAKFMSSQATSMELAELTATASWATEMMEFQLGFRRTPPKKFPTSRNTIMNQNLNFPNSTMEL